MRAAHGFLAEQARACYGASHIRRNGMEVRSAAGRSAQVSRQMQGRGTAAARGPVFGPDAGVVRVTADGGSFEWCLRPAQPMFSASSSQNRQGIFRKPNLTNEAG